MPSSRLLLGPALGLLALACANEPPTVVEEDGHVKTIAVVTVDRSDPASTDTTGNASAVARFVTVPAYAEASRVLRTAGAALDLPAFDTCQASDAEDIEPPAATQDPIELVEAGDVAISAAGTTTPLVPHAFPTVGAFASGVLYATPDRETSALPFAVPYVVNASGSEQVSSVRLVADAPQAPAQITVAGTALKDVTDIRTSRAIDLAWAPGDALDAVYVELLAYDGSTSVVCSFRDDSGSGVVPAEAFAGTGSGRLAIHRVRVRHGETTSATLSSELRFDFQVGAAVEFVR